MDLVVIIMKIFLENENEIIGKGSWKLKKIEDRLIQVSMFVNKQTLIIY